MKDKIKNIAEKLEHQIRMHELDLNDRIKDIPQIILLLEQGVLGIERNSFVL